MARSRGFVGLVCADLARISSSASAAGVEPRGTSNETVWKRLSFVNASHANLRARAAA
jgi:hypothetical protein